LTTPDNQISEFGSDFIYPLEASDISGIASWLINDTLNFHISPNGTLTNSTFLEVGAYGLNIVVIDPYGNSMQTMIQISVRDTTPPTWVQQPSNQTIQYGTEFYYDLNASDLSGIESWEIDDDTSFDIDENGILYNTTMLSIGIYSLRVMVSDPYNNTLAAMITITVMELTTITATETITSTDITTTTTPYTEPELLGYVSIIITIGSIIVIGIFSTLICKSRQSVE
jgi:hypothetical protein